MLFLSVGERERERQEQRETEMSIEVLSGADGVAVCEFSVLVQTQILLKARKLPSALLWH